MKLKRNDSLIYFEKDIYCQSTDFSVSISWLKNIIVVVFTIDHAKEMNIKNKENLCLSSPIAYFVSDSLNAYNIAEKLVNHYILNFKPMAGSQYGMIQVEKNEKSLSMPEIDIFHDKGFNALRHINGHYFIWDDLILGACTEYGERILRLSNYMAYSWAMDPKNLYEKASRFQELVARACIEIGNNCFRFSNVTQYHVPRGLTMSLNGYCLGNVSVY